MTIPKPTKERAWYDPDCECPECEGMQATQWPRPTHEEYWRDIGPPRVWFEMDDYALENRRSTPLASAVLARFGIWVVTDDGGMECLVHDGCDRPWDLIREEVQLAAAVDAAPWVSKGKAEQNLIRVQGMRIPSVSHRWWERSGKFRAPSRDFESARTFAIARVRAQPQQIVATTQPTRRSGLAPRLRFEALRRDNFRCQLCGRASTDGVSLEVDHIVPFSKGGSDSIENLWTLCWDCNRGKSDTEIV